MPTALQINLRLLSCLFFFLLVLPAFAEQPPSAQEKPKEGATVYLVYNRLVAFHEGIEKPAEDYRTSVGAPALAVIKRDGKIVGEVVCAPLPDSPADEAKSNASSVKNSDKIKLVEKKKLKLKKDTELETVTLGLTLKSNFGEQPWVCYSVYFPAKEACVTFKLLTAEKDFAELRPIFEKMLLIERYEPMAK